MYYFWGEYLYYSLSAAGQTNEATYQRLTNQSYYYYLYFTAQGDTANAYLYFNYLHDQAAAIQH